MVPDIKELLKKMIELQASDMHIVVGVPPILRVNGQLEPLTGYDPMAPEECQETIYSVMNEDQVAEFEKESECDMSFGIEGLSRFRLNVYRDRGSVVGAFRSIPFEILTFDQLGLPRVVADMAYKPLGLVLVCGPTGSGKSTTLAAILDRINRERQVHIITIEDPIEYIHQHDMSVVNQREVHADTKSFAAALRHVLRQDPDVILIGEMRDSETIQAALTVAETGHLAFATLHTNTPSKPSTASWTCSQRVNRNRCAHNCRSCSRAWWSSSLFLAPTRWAGPSLWRSWFPIPPSVRLSVRRSSSKFPR